MAYLSVDEYVAAFPRAETIRATDETKTGTVDRTKVEKAIAASSTEADSYLAVRYVLPIPAPTPEIVSTIVADLTRERLNRTSPTDLIIQNATRARSQLKDLSAGRAVIPATLAGAAPETLASGDAISSHDGRPRIFTNAALSDYVGLNTPGARYDFGN